MTEKPISFQEESYPLAGLLCLCGFFLHIILSDPLLNSFGFHYSGDEGRVYEKIHPGTVFIFLSFAVLLWSGRKPFEKLYLLYKAHTAAIALFLFYVLALLYMTLRSGAAGLAFIIDTHMTAAICAIVICHTPASYCKKAVYFFVAIALLNSCIGIVEVLGKFRIFTFDADWPILKEQYFRASALRGHPLNNTMFTAVALFVSMSLRYHILIKMLLVIIFMISLVAFGGRAGLLFSYTGIVFLGFIALKNQFYHERHTLFKFIRLCAIAISVPLCLAAILYMTIGSPLGERIAAHAGWDKSAHSRQLVFMVFDYMTDTEIWLGMSSARVQDIVHRVNLAAPLFDIENPWLLMFMYLGLIMFCV